MVAKVLCSTLLGIEAVLVEIEAQAAGGKTNVRIVGLPDGVLREARERVRCAIVNSGFQVPAGEVVVSLAPADLPKAGSGMDLAIALAVLGSDGQIDTRGLKGKLFLGELALDGRIKPVPGVVAASILARRRGDLTLVVPEGNAGDVSFLSDVVAEQAGHLKEVAASLSGAPALSRVEKATAPAPPGPAATFADVRGQLEAKRVLEIVAAGAHHLLLIGPPGSGKSMLAERLGSILPVLGSEELVEVLCVHDASPGGGGGYDARKLQRPFRAPHHSCSIAGLVGGGPAPQPGEISLAHRGVLFLDELPEFRRDALESLRQPIEGRRLTLSRASRRVTFPADFILVAAMNPCPCGKKKMKGELCRCTPPQVRRYLSKISGPILDRIDLHLWIGALSATELTSAIGEDPTPGMRERVCNARKMQASRSKKPRMILNSALSPKLLAQFCVLDSDSKKVMEEAIERVKLTARGYMRALKVARTIADLAESEIVETQHISEALKYRLQFEKLIDG